MTKHSREVSNHLHESDNLRHGLSRDTHLTGSVMSSSTSSASKTATYCSIGGPGPPAYYDQAYNQTNTLRSYHGEPYTSSLSRSNVARQQTCRDDRSSSLASFTRTVYYNEPTTAVSIGNASRTSTDRRATSPSSNLSTEGIVYPCGGHCRAFERCFHYFLQFFFVIGILAGISLVLAAYRIHHQRPAGDQLVLVYIGVLIALVCTLLLSIQCSVEREIKRKMRRRQIAISLAKNRNRAQAPLRFAEPDRGTYMEMVSAPTSNMAPMTFCQVPLIAPEYHYQTQQLSNDDVNSSRNGVPWWRRHEIRAVRNEYVV